MKNIVLAVICLFSSMSNASILDEITNKQHEFNAINHMRVVERVLPASPSPGDAFIVNGFGSFEIKPNVKITFAYDIGGVFTSFEDGKLSFVHGIPMDDVSNLLSVYIDVMTGDDLEADENNALSYVDGEKLFTMDVISDGRLGYLTPNTLSGSDSISFQMSNEYKAQYGITGSDIQMSIESTIFLADIINGVPSSYSFGAFECGALANPYDSCSRESGVATFKNVAETPLPPSIFLFMSGLGALIWKNRT